MIKRPEVEGGGVGGVRAGNVNKEKMTQTPPNGSENGEEKKQMVEGR
jgi:hypothetical protein